MNNILKRVLFIVIVILLLGGVYYFWQTRAKKSCGLENCHGLEIQCGSKIAQICTTEFASGDVCRRYAECEEKNGICQQVINDNFTSCKSCVQDCQKQYPSNPTKSLDCESKCTPTQMNNQETQKYAFPIKNFKANQTKKVFGQFITPQNSPVQPERFTGYHTGVDIEVSPSDLNKAVPVYAITAGTIRSVRDDVSGYGGVVVIEYKINNQTVTAIYGHIKYFSVEKKEGDPVSKGEQIAILGTPGFETDNERKHLHFGIHKGAAIDIRGYVQNKSELSAWIDPDSLYE